MNQKKEKKNEVIRFRISDIKREFIELITDKSEFNKSEICNIIFWQGVSFFLEDLKRDLTNLDYNLSQIKGWVNGENYETEIRRFVNFSKMKGGAEK
jgi:hypothetical protein